MKDRFLTVPLLFTQTLGFSLMFLSCISFEESNYIFRSSCLVAHSNKIPKVFEKEVKPRITNPSPYIVDMKCFFYIYSLNFVKKYFS